MIIGLTGPLASGKGTITKYLAEKYYAKAVKFSQPLRDMIHRCYVKETRNAMSELAQLMRKEYGNDILVRTLIQDLEKMDVPVAVFDGIRYEDEYKALRERKDFVLWAIDADDKKRYERLVSRGENDGDAALTFEAFKKQHELATEQMIPELMKKADVMIDNNESLEELYKRIDEIMHSYEGKN